MQTQTGKNFPEPRTAADRIALKAAELLDEDVYGPITSTHVTIRGARFFLGSYTTAIQLETGFDGDGGHFVRAGLTPGIEQVFRQAWLSAVERRKAKLLTPVEQEIDNDAHEQEQRAKNEAAAARLVAEHRREQRKERVILAAIAAAGVVLLLGIAALNGAFTPTKVADEVNAFGFRKADFPTRRQWVYPDGCFPDDNRFSGLPACKAQLEAWESEGAVWVDWRGEGSTP